jgi:polyisoprenoid-binding protein YceI
MKKLARFVAIASLMGVSAQAADYMIDSAHSSANFKIKHLVSKVSGGFNDFSGEFSFDENNPKSFKGEFMIKTASINTNNAKRDEHLRSDDFFGAEKNPVLTFKARELKSVGKGKFKLIGDFTMRGVTKPATFDVEYMGAGKDPWGNDKVGFSAVSKINRKDWGMSFNKVLDAGGFMLGDEVEIDIQIEGNGKAPANGKK